MKSILVHFEDKEYVKLKKAKGKKSWRDFIMELLENGE